MAAPSAPLHSIFPHFHQPQMATKTFKHSGWLIQSRKLPISRASQIDTMNDRLGIPVPEMIFGDNLVCLTHAATHWKLCFNAPDALDRVDKTDKGMLKVAYAKEWSGSRELEEVKEVVKGFDWSYSTDYKGSVEEDPRFKPETEPIPMELLARRDPILHFEEVVLYESELDDNGVSIYSVKVRVMEERMLLLARNFMRLDDVLIRIRDTRVYLDFKTNKVTREYTALEEKFDVVKQKLLSSRLPDDVTAAMRDPNQMAPLLQKVDYSLESTRLPLVGGWKDVK